MGKIIHGHSIYNNGNVKMSRTYVSWNSMKQRCYNHKHKAYKKYNGKGIIVCDRWKNSFVNFLEDMGERPKETSLDRINCAGNYEPGNCRWADIRTQSENKIKSYIPFNGEITSTYYLSEKYNIKRRLLIDRITRGWSINQALGLEPRRPKISSLKNIPDISRIGQIKWFRKQGCTLSEIGKFYGLTRARIGQILERG